MLIFIVKSTDEVVQIAMNSHAEAKYDDAYFEADLARMFPDNIGEMRFERVPDDTQVELRSKFKDGVQTEPPPEKIKNPAREALNALREKAKAGTESSADREEFIRLLMGGTP